MQILGDVRVMCHEDDEYDSKGSFEIPSRPADRVAHCRNTSTTTTICEQSTKTPCEMVLRYGCEKGPPEQADKVCPIGYQECPKHKGLEAVCPPREHENVGWRDFTCCFNGTQVGLPLYGVREAPTYVQVFGYMKWAQKQTKRYTSEDYCPWRGYRCQLLNDFASNGIKCNFLLGIEAIALFLAVCLGFSRYRHKFMSFIAVLYLAAGGTGVLGRRDPEVYKYRNKYVTDSLVEEDSLLKPHFDDPEIGANGKPWSPGNPEWAYYKFNAQIDYTTRDPEYPEGYRRLWGWRLGCAQCVLCFLSCICALELFFAYQNASPILGVIQLFAFIMCCVPCVCRTFIDNYLAPYPVLWIYPWQKLYPKSFTVGSWLPEPFDTIYDCVLMLPERRAADNLAMNPWRQCCPLAEGWQDLQGLEKVYDNQQFIEGASMAPCKVGKASAGGPGAGVDFSVDQTGERLQTSGGDESLATGLADCSDKPRELDKAAVAKATKKAARAGGAGESAADAGRRQEVQESDPDASKLVARAPPSLSYPGADIKFGAEASLDGSGR
ncbi:unnamed protein product [Prorocentrum cordatum]|uniref:Uncharacterized protein n=1 Tax=Prorocentrum cordatum TaxID=2364126 RepID=A0ABN9TF40_9DINO|nr:unnamed protein product [Polarella glacialis]